MVQCHGDHGHRQRRQGADTASHGADLTGSITPAESLKIDPRRKTVLNRISATLRRWDYPYSDSALIDAQALERSCAGRDVTERSALKVAMRATNLLPRYS
jgi:hypothetical protein